MFKKRTFSEKMLKKIKLHNAIKDIAVGKQKPNFVCCPAHNDTNPSAHVTPNIDGDIWYCFSCGAGGDVIKFAEYLYRLSFVEACYLLGANASEQQEFTAEEIRIRSELKHKEREMAREEARKAKIHYAFDYYQNLDVDSEKFEVYIKNRLGMDPASKFILPARRGIGWDAINKCAVILLKDEDNTITGVHRYFLNDDGNDCVKINGKRKKLSLGHVKGSVKFIVEHETYDIRRCIVAEGIETGVAISYLPLLKFRDANICCAISATNVPNLDWLFYKYDTICVAGDNDIASREAFERLRKLCPDNKTIEYLTPHHFGFGNRYDGQDFLDFYLKNKTSC